MDFNETLAMMQQKYPKLRVVDYRDNWFFAILIGMGWSMGATTLWDTILMEGDLIGTQTGAEMLLHEYAHVQDIHRWHILFLLSYFLLLPIGPSFKAFWEWRGYKTSLRVSWLKYGSDQAAMHRDIENIVTQFTSAAYAFMWPFPGMVRRWCNEEISRLEATEKR